MAYGSKLTEATADGSGDPVVWNGGVGYFQVEGTLDGASVALELSRNDGASWQEITTLSAVDIVAVDLPTCQVRATVSGAGASTNVTVLL